MPISTDQQVKERGKERKQLTEFEDFGLQYELITLGPARSEKFGRNVDAYTGRRG
jgi:hypothetical protein